MNTALIIKEAQPPRPGYEFILRGVLLGDDIENLGLKIQETIERQSKQIQHITLDITETHDFLFKPTRLLGLCNVFNRRLKEMNENISINLVINQRQQLIFGGLEARSDFSIRVQESVPESWKKLAREELQTLRTCANFKIASLVCFLVLIGSFLFLQKTPLGFALFFSSAMLLIEGFVVLRMYSKKRRFLKAISNVRLDELQPSENWVFST